MALVAVTVEVPIVAVVNVLFAYPTIPPVYWPLPVFVTVDVSVTIALFTVPFTWPTIPPT